MALQADGWYLRSDIIWHKPNPMPESVTDRPTKSHEYLFLLTKSPTYYYDSDAIAEPITASSVERLSQDVEAQEGSDRVPGKTNGKMKAVVRIPRGEIGAPSQIRSIVSESGDRYMSGRVHAAHAAANGLPATRNARSVWTVTTQPFREAHFATFPPKLIEPCILAGSARQACEKCGAPWARDVECGEFQPPASRPDAVRCEGNGESTQMQKGAAKACWSRERSTLGFKPTCDCENEGSASSTVIDPFGGAGTTGLVADRLGRDALLIELNPAYAKMARERIHSDNPLFGDVA